MLDTLYRTLRRDPERPALLGHSRGDEPRVIARRGDIADLADGYAAALYSRHGLRPGDTLGVAARPGLHTLAVMLAAHRLGLRVAALNPAAGPDVMRAGTQLAAPSLIIADALVQAVAGWAAPVARRARIAMPRLDELGPAVVTVGPRRMGCAPALETSGCAPAPPFDVDEQSDAVIIFTSGTTAAPRAVVHSRASLAAGMRAVADLVGPNEGSIVLGGTFFVQLPALAGGATVALPALSPGGLGRQIARLKPDETYLTPPEAREVRHFTGRVWLGSAPVSARLLGRIRDAGATEAWGVYAMTECFPVSAVEYDEKAAFTAAGDLVGSPLPGVQAKVSETGELLLTGAGVRDRYLGEEPDPWVRTGDRAMITADGQIVLEGRCKDMVLRNAENIYPGLYEPSLHLPDVESALLVGIPDGDGDERLVAMIQARIGADRKKLLEELEVPFARMGSARPDEVVFATVPLKGRSRKPDREKAAQRCAKRLAKR
ncbi:class I adenylate-forming enzyme family protein [Actinospica robiniae]|uniref:class I adenylate-forming enzyme family protein n=1 Tax=Actinospica robiniae TaxID=304901 RepID=UPI0004155779|nr:class I adenylate-forming enzyme family protein [Actinospica robiniae]